MIGVGAPKILHPTTVHPGDDSRILYKECKTLADAGYDVYLAAYGPTPPNAGGVRFISLGDPPRGRLRRMLEGRQRVRDVVRQLQPTVVHIHDPELILLGRSLHREGYRVIYDSHEDLPAQVQHKYWIPRILMPAAVAYAKWLDRTAATLTAVIAATPVVAEGFPSEKTTVVRNAPRLSEFREARVQALRDGELRIAYVGALSKIRGLFEGLDAVATLKDRCPQARFVVAGPEGEPGIVAALHAADRNDVLDYRGVLGRTEVANLLAECQVGLVTLHATKNDMESLPIKMFEYMAAGLPVIASHHPLWRPIIEKRGLGMTVDPTRPAEISAALSFLIDHPDEAQRMGENGRRYVQEEFNWSLESQKLLKMYEQLLS